MKEVQGFGHMLPYVSLTEKGCRYTTVIPKFVSFQGVRLGGGLSALAGAEYNGGRSCMGPMMPHAMRTSRQRV